MKSKTFTITFWLGSLLFLFFQKIALSQTLTVQGEVTSSETLQGIPGVTIHVLGTSNGTVSDATGKYRLSGVSPDDSLVFSSVGYKMQTIAVEGQEEINITLSPNISQLDQLVVIGYGTIKKK